MQDPQNIRYVSFPGPAPENDYEKEFYDIETGRYVMEVDDQKYVVASYNPLTRILTKEEYDLILSKINVGSKDKAKERIIEESNGLVQPVDELEFLYFIASTTKDLISTIESIIGPDNIKIFSFFGESGIRMVIKVSDRHMMELFRFTYFGWSKQIQEEEYEGTEIVFPIKEIVKDNEVSRLSWKYFSLMVPGKSLYRLEGTFKADCIHKIPDDRGFNLFVVRIREFEVFQTQNDARHSGYMMDEITKEFYDQWAGGENEDVAVGEV